MDAREWALIIYTILFQMAVGSFIVLGIVHYFAVKKHGEEEAEKLSDRTLLAIGPLLVVGMLASLFHLGNPLKSYTAVVHFATSWLSREIILTVLFFILGGLFAIMQWRKISSAGVRNIIALIAALVGLVGVYAMSRIYMIPAQPSWNTWFTPVFFFATTFLLGALAVGAAYAIVYAFLRKKEPEQSGAQLAILGGSLRWLSVAAVSILGIQLIAYPLYFGFLAGGPPAAVQSIHVRFNVYGMMFALRLILAFVGAGILALFLYQNAASEKQERVLGVLAVSAFALVLVAEVIARYIFYASHVGIGV